MAESNSSRSVDLDMTTDELAQRFGGRGPAAEVSDERRRRIVERCSSQLSSMLAEAEGWYPDKVMTSAQLRREHSGFCDRLGSLANDMGYASFAELLHNEGFDIELDRRAAAHPVGHRIAPEDAVDHIVWSVTDRLGGYFEKIDEWYPDRVVTGFAKLHGKTKDNLSRQALALGYESWADLLRDYDYEVPDYSSSGGRPVTTDPEAIISELMARYEGIGKPKSVGILMFENPDLKGKLKTLQNSSKEFFGHTLAVELQERGLIEGAPSSTAVSDDDIREMLDVLTAKYSNAPIRPNSIAELKADNPDHAFAIAAFSNRCRMIFGCAPRNKLIELGVFEKPKGAVIDATDEEIWQAMDDVSKLVFERADADKPKTLVDLQNAYPEFGEYVKAGKKKGILDKALLQKLGILAPTVALLKREGIRRTSVESLTDDYRKLGLPLLITPGSGEGDQLPYGVIGLDIDSQAELHECIATAKGEAADGLSLGDEIEFDFKRLSRDWGEPYTALEIKTTPETTLHPKSVFDSALNSSDSALSPYVGGEVISVACTDEFHAAQIRVRYLSTLNRDTLAYVMRQCGAVVEKDLQGSMEWRYRIQRTGLVKDGEAGDDSALSVQQEGSQGDERGGAEAPSTESLDGASKQIYEFLLDYVGTHGCAPTVREVADAAGCSVSKAHQRMGLLESQGFITRDPGKPRAMMVAGLQSKAPRQGDADDESKASLLHKEMAGSLSGRHREAFVFIDEYIALNGYGPSVRNIADHLNISPSTAHGEINYLREIGFVRQEEGAARTLSIVSRDEVDDSDQADTGATVASEPAEGLRDGVQDEAAEAPVIPTHPSDTVVVEQQEDSRTDSLSESQKKYLATITKIAAEGQTVRAMDIADELGVSRPAVSKALASLENAGLIQRDGRNVRLTSLVTDGGEDEGANTVWERSDAPAAAAENGAESCADGETNVSEPVGEGEGVSEGWTFAAHQRAAGRRFSVEVPDQWVLTPDEGGRPLARYEQDIDDEGECPQIICSAMAGDLDEKTQATLRENVLPEVRIQLSRKALYSNEMANALSRVVNDWVVEGKNCQVLVFEILMPSIFPGITPDSYEYHVKPVAYDHEDFLRLTDSWGHLGEGQLKELAFAIAPTLELDKPVELKRLAELGRYCEEPADADAFRGLVGAISNMLNLSASERMNADLWREIRRSNNDKSCLLGDGTMPRIQAEACNVSLGDEVAYYGRLVTALERQYELGVVGFEQMWKLVGEFGGARVVDHMTVEGSEETAEAANSLGIISIPAGYEALHKRWEALDPAAAVEAEARRKAEEEAARKAEMEARSQAEEAARKAEEAKRRAEDEARRKAEEEAPRRAEMEARRQAEEEARRRAEDEARRKAEEEAARRAEEEAKRKAEEEAVRRAEEARRKAEEEAARRAEEEARRRAEEEARRKAEEEARRRAEEEAARLAEIEAAQKAEAEARQKMQDARIDLSSARSHLNSLTSKSEQLEAQIRDHEHRISEVGETVRNLERVEADLDSAKKELDGLGFFAFGRKNELRKMIQQLEQDQKELGKGLPTDIDEFIKGVERQRDEVVDELIEVEGEIAECQRRIDAFEAILAQGQSL